MKNKIKKLIVLSLSVVMIFATLIFVCLNNKTRADETNKTTAVEENAESFDASQKGGAVYVGAGSHYVMNGGIISGCSSVYGGAVYVEAGGKFTMKGGTIENNIAVYGSAIYVESGGVCEILGGEIKNNGSIDGSVIYIQDGEKNGYTRLESEVGFEGNYTLTNVTLNYFVDNTMIYSEENPLTPSLNNINVTLDEGLIENYCGYYLDADLTIPATNKAIKDKLLDNLLNNGGGFQYVDIFTKKATDEIILEYAPINNNTAYSVRCLTTINEDVVIPKEKEFIDESGTTVMLPVTKIDDDAFVGCQIKNIYLPTTITEIGDCAFNEMSTLETINYTSNVEIFGEYSFNDCVNLKAISIEKATRIGEYAFKGDSFANFDNLSKRIEYVGDYAFYGCAKLTGIVKINHEIINAFAFCDTGITEIELGDKVKCVKNSAFCNSKVDKLNLSNCVNLESIEEKSFAFYNPLKLIDLRYCNKLKTIGVSAFGSTQSYDVVKEVYIPELRNFMSIDFSNYNANPTYSADKVYAYNPTTRTSEEITEVVVPKTITEIKQYTLVKSSIVKVDIPSHVTKVQNNAFYGSVITDLTIGNGLENVSSSMFGGCSKLINLNLDSSMVNNAFKGKTNIQKVTFGSSVRTIPEYAFSGCSKLSGLIIPNTVETINQYAFQNCSTIDKLEIPDSVTFLGDYAFAGCSNVVSINIGSGLTNEINNTMFVVGANSKLQTLVIDSNIADSLTNLGANDTGGAFYQTKSLKTITFGANVTKIGHYAFRNCNNLISVNMSESNIESIGRRAFNGATNLKSIVIPETLKIIYDRAFSGCNNIPGTLTLPESLETIETRVFDMCYNIEEIIIKSNAVSIADYAFAKTRGLKKIFIPESATLGKYLFNADASASSWIVSEQNNWSVGQKPPKKSEFLVYTDATNIPSTWNDLWNNCLAIDYDYVNQKFIVGNYDFILDVSLDDYMNSGNQGFIYSDADSTILEKYEGSASVVFIPEGVKTISERAFENANVKVVVFPESLSGNGLQKQIKALTSEESQIKENAFLNCVNLQQIVFKASVMPLISYSAFDGCNQLKTIQTYDLTQDQKVGNFMWAELERTSDFATAWIAFVSNETITYTKTTGDGTENNPYLIKEFKPEMLENLGGLLETINVSNTERILVYPTVSITQTTTNGGSSWSYKSHDSSNKVYWKLVSDIDFGHDFEPLNLYASISIDGNGFTMDRFNGASFEETHPALVKNAYDCEIKNININYGYSAVTLFYYTYGTIKLENITINNMDDEEYMFLNEAQHNFGPFVVAPQSGSVTFESCVNNLDIKSIASYFGVFIGAYPSSKVSISLNKCVNNGDIYTGFVAGIFFGNNYVKPKTLVITNFINNGTIYGKQYYRTGSSYNYESHVLAPLTSTASTAFSKDEVKMYDNKTSGDVINTVASVVENQSIYSIIDDGNGCYSISAPEGQTIPANKTFRFLMRASFRDGITSYSSTFNVMIKLEFTFDGTKQVESLGKLYKEVIDRDSYIKKGNSDLDDSLFTNELGNIDYMFANINNYYVIDTNNEWFAQMTPDYTGNGSNGTRMWTIAVIDNETGKIDGFICKPA